MVSYYVAFDQYNTIDFQHSGPKNYFNSEKYMKLAPNVLLKANSIIMQASCNTSLLNNASTIIILAMSVLSIFGCSDSRNVFETTYNNEKVIVSCMEKKGFSTNTVTYSVPISNRKKIPFNHDTIDIYDRPYSNGLFAEVPHYFFNADTPAYKNEIDFERKIAPTMLYVSPAKYSKEDFEAYADLFKNKWPAIVAKINKNWTYFHKLVVGIAYGNHGDFIQYFTGRYNNAPYYFDISPDGQILFHQGVPPGNTGFESAGLANKVQMPGKRIVFTDTSMLTPEKLLGFKDQYGRSMADYFTIEAAVRQ